MFTPIAAFSGFSVDDITAAKQFYSEVLGMEVSDETGGARLVLPAGASAFMYPKKDHVPATYTMLDFVVEDIDAAVDELTTRGAQFERYEGMPQDEKGIMRGRSAHMGPDIAWFKDPAGNILAVLQSD
jgi:catechol 2,3-dioxygenase-like lactoylglutathione lyase family enzyme